MKIEFVDGYYEFPATMVIYSNPFSRETDAGFYRKRKKLIVVVKQKSIFYTINILLHELLHFFNCEFFESNSKIDDLIEKIQAKCINPIIRKILIRLEYNE